LDWPDADWLGRGGGVGLLYGTGLRVPRGASEGPGPSPDAWLGSTAEIPASDASAIVLASAIADEDRDAAEAGSDSGVPAPGCCPVSNNLRKASTSSDALPGVRASGLLSSSCCPGSISCRVLLKGFRWGGPGWTRTRGGAWPFVGDASRLCQWSSTGGCISTRLSESESESEEGGGGGDCTRTRFPGFDFRSAGLCVVMGAGLAMSGAIASVARATVGDGDDTLAALFRLPLRLKGLFVVRESADIVVEMAKRGRLEAAVRAGD
jgi:hypothetical protein